MQSQQYGQNIKASFFCSFYCILDVGSGGLVLSQALFWLAQHVPAPAQQVSTQMKCQVLLLVYSHFLFPPLLRQQDDCDSDRRHRMKSEPLNPHISVDSTMKNVTILNFFVLSVPLLRQMDFALITVMCWCYRCEPKICAEELDGRVCDKESWDERFFRGVFINLPCI